MISNNGICLLKRLKSVGEDNKTEKIDPSKVEADITLAQPS